jgi:hypothetical protein
MKEPYIIINGQRLSVGEAMALRVAVQNYIGTLRDSEYPLGNDEHGKLMTKSYLRHLGTINEKMLSGVSPE